MIILGINAYHADSSACIFVDGKLIAAIEEERIRRVKHWAGLPTEAIKFCLNEAKTTLDQVDYITISRNPRAKVLQKILYVLKNFGAMKGLMDRGANSMKVGNIKSDISSSLGYDVANVKAKISFVEHHRSHLASSFYPSPFEKAALLSIDGMGDFSSTMWGIGDGHKIEVLGSISYPHSLGVFYTAVTQYLGFKNYGDEYKVMGLSPYGEAKHIEKLKKILILRDNGMFELNPKFFAHFKGKLASSWEDGIPSLTALYTDEWSDLLGPLRKKEDALEQYHMDLAASAQRLVEHAIFNIANSLQEKTGLSNICLSGGCAQNSVANGKLIENTSFEKLYVPPAGHDAGTSVGSSLYLLHNELKRKSRDKRNQAYTGSKFSNDEIEEYLNDRNIKYKKLSDSELFSHVSNALLDSGVIGWFQGRSEFGPRALGNRSILVDPRRKDAKELLNKKIKKRESFRPFAPSILSEYVEDWFGVKEDVPFMEKVYGILPNKQHEIPAVTHVDGSGRLQSVAFEDNQRYYLLIKDFFQKTGVPILLNTSFNENEPIVNSPKDALDCFLRTKMDMLVMENIVIER